MKELDIYFESIYAVSFTYFLKLLYLFKNGATGILFVHSMYAMHILIFTHNSFKAQRKVSIYFKYQV